MDKGKRRFNQDRKPGRPAKQGRPEFKTYKKEGIDLPEYEAEELKKISAGAGFIVVLTGEIMTMPGLPKSPAAERIDVDENGRITGLF